MLKHLFWLSVFSLTSPFVVAQSGSNDASFNTLDDCSNGDGSGFYGSSARAIAVQSDGKVLIGGTFSSYNSNGAFNIVRLTPDGGYDASFITAPGANGYVESIAVQPDGKILIGGNFTSFHGTSFNRIVRVNSDGSVDNTFNPGSGCNLTVNKIIVQPDGKLLVGGSFSSFNGTPVTRLVRLNEDGTLDNTFNTGTGINNNVSAIELQPDGKILIGGDFTLINGTSRARVARLNTDGSLDMSFDPGTGFKGWVRALILQPDGKVVAGGSFTSCNGTAMNGIARLNADGSTDGTFLIGTGFTNLVAFNGVSTLNLQPDGKIVVGGGFADVNGVVQNSIARLNTDGSLDLSYDIGTGFNHAVLGTYIQPDGKIIAAGSFTEFNCNNGLPQNYIVRLQENGHVDGSFGFTTGFDDVVTATAFQPDGKILVGGDFHICNGHYRRRISRLNADGSIDLAFNPGNGFDSDDVVSLAVQQDGKILAGGWFNSFDGNTANYIARLNSDGSFDSTFNMGTGFNGNVSTVVLQADGKILVGGYFTSYNGIPANYIVRLNSDGTPDLTFNVGSGFNNFTSCLVIQPDGKILVSGGFGSFNGTTRNKIARINADGTLDTSFNPGVGPDGYVETIVLQPDGKIIIGGAFINYASTSRKRIARLTNSGSLDASFNPGSGFNQTVRSAVVQADGKVVAVGVFTTFAGNTANYIARLDVSGAWDPTFAIGAGFNDDLLTVGIQPDGKLVIGGFCTSFDGICRNKIARLYGDCNSASVLNIGGCDSVEVNGAVYYTTGTYSQTMLNSAGCDSLITINVTVGPVNVAVNQIYTNLEALETVADFQWLDCENGFAEIPGETNAFFMAGTTGSVAVRIDKSGCIDTSACITIVNQDFYDTPGYLSFSGEVFAFPVSTVDTCDALALAYAEGGVYPYTYDWQTQPNNENNDVLDSLCEGIHVLKITDNIGDSILVDYYVTDTANFYSWYDTLAGFVDTIYIAAPNCLIDFSLPLDSAEITMFYYLMPDTLPPGDLFFIEIEYYQAGTGYTHQDTISIEDLGWYLIDFSVYCPIKSFNKIKTILLNHLHPNLVSVDENDKYALLPIYPNPTNGTITISGLPSEGKVEVFNMFGELVLQQTISSAQLKLDISDHADGLYLIRVLANDYYYSAKVTKN